MDPAEIKFGKTKVDRNSTLLFFRKAIGVYAREHFDQGSLSMVDVSCCPDYNVHQNRNNAAAGMPTTERKNNRDEMKE